MDDVKRIRVALFGESGSGKTTFIQSYTGTMMSEKFLDKNGYRLLAQGSKEQGLFHKWKEMTTSAVFPAGTDGFEEYAFKVAVAKKGHGAEYDEVPGVEVVLYDYPGGWLNQAPSDRDEVAAYRRAQERLMESNVGVFLIDGERFKKECEVSRVKYVDAVLERFCHFLRVQEAEFQRRRVDPQHPRPFPQHWVVMLTKADLLDGFMVSQFAEEVRKQEGLISNINAIRLAAGEGNEHFGFANWFGDVFVRFAAVDLDIKNGEITDGSIGIPALMPLLLSEYAKDEVLNLKKTTNMDAMIYALHAALNTVFEYKSELPKPFRAAVDVFSKKIGLSEMLKRNEKKYKKIMEQSRRVRDVFQRWNEVLAIGKKSYLDALRYELSVRDVLAVSRDLESSITSERALDDQLRLVSVERELTAEEEAELGKATRERERLEHKLKMAVRYRAAMQRELRESLDSASVWTEADVSEWKKGSAKIV